MNLELCALHRLVSQSRRPHRPPTNERTVGLLSEALRVDPGDTISPLRLIEFEARYLNYTLHEVPAGVLYDFFRGATVEECDELLARIGDFVSLVELAGVRENYKELIQDCAFHYQSYRDYLLVRTPGDSYKAYLENRQT